MKIITKRSPQGIDIEFIEYVPAHSQPILDHLSTMVRLNREDRNRRDERAARKGASK